MRLAERGNVSTRMPSMSRTGDLGKTAVLALLPIPIGGEFREAAVASFAFSQFCDPFLHGLFQQGVEILESPVQQTYLDPIADARLHFDEIEGLADEILGSHL